ncbi:MAG TPA: hypothetical protein VF637_13130 [Sphingomicrobium sp.]|jgi:hypothetical protein
MTNNDNRLSWSARLLIALTLILAGAATSVWALARYDKAARFLGVVDPVPNEQPAEFAPAAQGGPLPPATAVTVPADDRVAQLEARLARVEQSSQRAEGSAGRADALVVAFAARRAIDRGVPLGFLEKLLIERFGAPNRQAVATIISASRQPVRLDQLRTEYEKLSPQLRGAGPNEGILSGLRREFGSIVEIRRASAPSMRPDARFARASQRLESGDVDSALAETMRMPGAAHASDWVGKARRYVAAHRALDEIESTALLAGASGR